MYESACKIILCGACSPLPPPKTFMFGVSKTVSASPSSLSDLYMIIIHSMAPVNVFSLLFFIFSLWFCNLICFFFLHSSFFFFCQSYLNLFEMENLAKFCMIKHKTNVRMFSDYARRSLRENKNKIPRSTAKQVSGKDKKKSYMSKKKTIAPLNP